MKAILILCLLAFALLMIALDYGKTKPAPSISENARWAARKHQKQIMENIRAQNARIHRLDTELTKKTDSVQHMWAKMKEGRRVTPAALSNK